MRLLILLILISASANAQIICKTKLQQYLMIKLYNITLCRKVGVQYDNIFQTEFTIKLKYRTSSSSYWISSRSLAEIHKYYNLTVQEKQEYKKHFTDFFPNVKNDDEIKMEFIPEYGAKFYYNGQFFGEIKDKTFAMRTANIWLHPNATFQDTRDFLFLNE